jgi:4-hydroxyphenylpyruvate dioxygenase
MSTNTRDNPSNPMGTDGIEFVEFAAPDPLQLDGLFRGLGFLPIARHRSKDVTLYRQGGINFILNAEAESFAQSFARVHGPSICAIALRVQDARAAAHYAKSLGAEVLPGGARPMELNIPAMRGIGGSLIYLVDRYEGPDSRVSIYDIDFQPIAGAPDRPSGLGFNRIDHLSCCAYQGRKQVWAEFLERIFNFREAPLASPDPTSLLMTSPCGQIRFLVREPGASDRKDPVVTFIDACHGEGIGHMALATADLEASVAALTASSSSFGSSGVYDAQGEKRQSLTLPMIGPIQFSLVQDTSE